MILDFQDPYIQRSFFDSDGRPLYEILDATTGKAIDEPIFYADDERGFYRRGVYLRPGTGDIAIRQVPGTGEPVVETVHRPIRIVPRLERLCASLRASLAEAGVSADDIPEPVLGALALFQERLEAIERFVVTRRESIRDHLPRRLMLIDHPEVSTPPVNSAEWLETVTTPASGPTPEQVDAWQEIVTREGLPWTRADLERFLPEVRVEAVTTLDGPTQIDWSRVKVD
jgi:hypothetical protein